MLVLQRQHGEVIKIGDDIEVCVTEIRGDKVKLGITAPPNVVVHRKEVYDDMKRNEAMAARVAAQKQAGQ